MSHIVGEDVSTPKNWIVSMAIIQAVSIGTPGYQDEYHYHLYGRNSAIGESTLWP